MRSLDTSRPKVARREFLPAFIVVFNSLVWYTLTYAFFSYGINNLKAPATATLTMFAFYYAAIACSGIAGALLSPKRRNSYLTLWMIVGASVTASLITIPNNSILVNTLMSVLLGTASGIGLPSCLACFAAATVVENRGTYGGITWGAIGLGILSMALVLQSAQPAVAFGTLTLWRALGVIAFVLSLRNSAKTHLTQNPSRFLSILHRRDVILYLIPWIMFSLINFTEAPILERILGNFYVIAGFIEFAITGLFALVAGFLADRVGRKRLVITGFVILGIEYALLSFFSGMSIMWYVYTVTDGVAWGMFASVFFMTLWGDLGGNDSKEKYYTLGGLPYFLAGFLPILVKPFAAVIQTGTAFSLASFFLFLAVLPLMYAPETLPEKTIKQHELEKYADDAKRIKEKSESKK